MDSRNVDLVEQDFVDAEVDPTPDVVITSPEVPDAQQVDLNNVLAAFEKVLPGLIERLVEQKFAEHQHGNPDGPGVVEPEAPHVWKAIYRCDQTPTLHMQKFDFLKAQKDAKARAFRPDAPHLYRKVEWVDGKKVMNYPYLLDGEWIEFKGGYFRTDDDNEIAQIEWSMSHNMIQGDTFTGRVIGGNPTIYRSSNAAVYECRMCDPVRSFGTDADRIGHMNATHRAIG